MPYNVTPRGPDQTSIAKHPQALCNQNLHIFIIYYFLISFLLPLVSFFSLVILLRLVLFIVSIMFVPALQDLHISLIFSCVKPLVL